MQSIEMVRAFWSRVDKTPRCWLWTGSKIGDYGTFKYRGSRQFAHRFSWELLRGPIPACLVIDHMCHEPRCVRPEHLRCVTHTANMQNRRGAHSNSQSDIRGVSWDPRRKRWCAQVKASKRKYFKRFETLREAELWAEALRAELHIPTPKL